MTLLRAAAQSLVPKQVSERLPLSAGRVLSPIMPGVQGTPLQALQAYGGVGWLFAAVSRIAQAVASVDWQLYEPQSRGERREVASHPALDLWRSVNPFFTREEFVETFQQHLDLVGEAYWVLVSPPRGGLELWPVRPDRIRPIPSKEDFVAGYEYRLGAEVVPLRREDVIFLRLPNPLDLYRGMGPVQAILADIDSERFSAQWNRNFFLNSAEPGGVVEYPEGLDDDEFERIVQRWREQHRGVANAHRVAIIEKGTWKDRKFSMRDMQFEQLRRVNRDIILGAYGMPKHILGVSEDVNRANAEAAEVMFSRWVVRPRLERLRSVLNERLLPKFPGGERLEFDFIDPTPKDMAQAIESLGALIRAGYDPAESLTIVGLPEISHTGLPPVTVQQFPIGQAPGARGWKEPGRVDRRPLPLIEGERRVTVERLEPLLERFFAAQAREIVGRLDALAGSRRDEPVAGISPDDLWPQDQDEELAVVLAPAMLRLAVSLGEALDGTLSRGVKQERDPDVELLLRESARRVVRINEHTRDVLRRALAEAAERGLSLFGAVNGHEDFRGIRGIVEETYRGRSVTIARTEAAWAANETALSRYRRAGVTELEIMDGDGDECCASRNGRRVPIAEKPELCHPRCTLVLLPVVALPEAASLAEARCPTCSKLLGKEVSTATLYCGKCKADVRYQDGVVVGGVTVRRIVERDEEGRIAAVVERHADR